MRALLTELVYVSLIPVAITPSVRTALVHLGTSMVSPFRVHARAVIIGVAPVVVAFPVRRSADIDSETRSLKVNSLRQGRRRAGPCNRADDAGSDP